MSGYQNEKNIVRDYYAALDTANGPRITEALIAHTAPEYIWRAFHPFHLQNHVNAVSEKFWQPFRHAVTHMQRRMDVFFAGANSVDDGESVWVCSMGHLMGAF